MKTVIFLLMSITCFSQAHVRGRNIITNPPVAYNFSASYLSNGSYSSNSIDANFTSTASVKSTSSGFPQIDPINDSDWVLETVGQRRDQTVSTYINKGSIFLRVQSNGTAIYLYHNAETANGILELGVVTGNINAGATIFDYSKVALWGSQDLVTLIGSGYTRNQAVDSFTVTAIGFEINVKYNGVDIPGFHISDYRIPMTAGKTGIKAASNSGVRIFNVNHLSNTSLYSDVAKKTIDVRDFGWKTGATTGTITGGTNQVTVAALNGLTVGDYIIIPTGYENSFNGRAAGTRGTKGVGKTFPALSYTDSSSMVADHSKSNGLYAWIETSGNVFKYDSVAGTWSQPTANYDFYYTGKANPIALRTKITAINGLVITLADQALVTATNAPVYFDNSWILNKLGNDPSHDQFPYKYPVANSDYRILTTITDTGWTVSIPSGTYALGEPAEIQNHPYFNLKGVSKTSTFLFSPNGTPSASIIRSSSPNSTNADYKLIGNARDNGYGLNWWSWANVNGSTVPLQTYTFSSAYYNYGNPVNTSSDCIYKNLAIEDVYYGGVTMSYSNRCIIDSCDGIKTQGSRTYFGWYFQCSRGFDMIIRNCTFTSTRAEGAFESFAGYNTIFRNNHSTNGYWSFNTAQFPRIEIDAQGNHNSATFTAGSISDWVSELQPILNVNNNLGNTSGGNGAGGYVEGFDMTIQNYQDANNDMFMGVSIQPQIDSVIIKNCTYTAPNWASPSAIAGPEAVRSEGTKVTIDGMVVTGTVNPGGGNGYYNTNIGVKYGTVKNCVANKIAVGTTVTLSNNTGAVATF